MIVADRIVGGETHSGDPVPHLERHGDRLRVSVIYTSIEGTLAALHTASGCAKGLCADIAIVVAEAVPFRYPVAAPPVRVSFFEKVCQALIEEARLERNRCDIEVHFCRDQVACLESTLRPKSLVVIGARKSWWRRRERGLERALNERGFDALLVYSGSKSVATRSDKLIERLAAQADGKVHVCERSGRLDLH
jgi:hypothetical protein